MLSVILSFPRSSSSISPGRHVKIYSNLHLNEIFGVPAICFRGTGRSGVWAIGLVSSRDVLGSSDRLSWVISFEDSSTISEHRFVSSCNNDSAIIWLISVDRINLLTCSPNAWRCCHNTQGVPLMISETNPNSIKYLPEVITIEGAEQSLHNCIRFRIVFSGPSCGVIMDFISTVDHKGYVLWDRRWSAWWKTQQRGERNLT